MGITITLLFWEAMIKGTRMIGTAEEQGRMFGLLEGGRGLFATIISFAALWMFTNFGEGRMGLRATMIFYAIALCGLGVVCFFLIEKNDVEGKVNAKEALDGLVHMAKLPRVWVAGGIVFFGYSFYNGLSYFSSYLTEICGMSVSMGVAVNIVRQYLIAFIAAPIGGMIADKMGSSINYLKIALTLGTILTGIYLVIPTTMGIVVVVGLMLVLAAVMMTIRGTYYATTDEIQIPIVMSGAAAGILSIVGNTPDLFIFTLYGYFMDAYPGIQGYRYIFIAMMAFAVLGVGCRKGIGQQAMEEAFAALLAQSGLCAEAFYKVCSIDLKRDEPGLRAFCAAHGFAFETFSAAQLAAVEGRFSSSGFVQSVTGVDNVCERSAVLGSGGTLYCKKQAGGGVTMAAAMAPFAPDWRWQDE